jgi:hypothetical protein
LGQLVLPSLRWILRRHHLVDDEATRKLIGNYMLSAWNIVQQFGALLDRVNPQSWWFSTACSIPKRRHAGRRTNADSLHHSRSGVTSFLWVFHQWRSHGLPIDIPHDFAMSPAQDKLLDDLLAERFKGNFSMAGIRFWPEMQPLSEEFWQRARQFKQIVPVFTNVVFDTSQDMPMCYTRTCLPGWMTCWKSFTPTRRLFLSFGRTLMKPAQAKPARRAFQTG